MATAQYPTRPSEHRLAGLAFLIPVAALLLFRLAVPANICDDAYISLRTAVHLATGEGMVFNVGERVYAVTTPLWVGLLAAFRYLTGDVIVAARVLGVAFELLLLLTFGQLVRRLSESTVTGVLAATLLVANPVWLLTSFSGMEVSLSLWLVCLALLLLVQQRDRAALLVAAIAVFARIDNLLLMVVVGLAIALRYRPWTGASVRRLTGLVTPAVIVLAVYALFGAVYYGSVVPASATFKASFNHMPLTAEWWSGATRLGYEFVKVFFGRSTYWFTESLHYWPFVIPLALGAIRVVHRRETVWYPLCAFTVLWIAAYTLPGSTYAHHFPWYFVPVLPGMYALAAWGLIWLIRRVARRRSPQSGKNLQWGMIALALAWPAIMFGPISRDAEYLTSGPSGSAERERVYAAAARWVTQTLPEPQQIAAAEIGAIGFFSGPDAHVLDLQGVARPREDRTLSTEELVRKHRPQTILVREFYEHRGQIERALPGAYSWHRFKSLDIGLRSDLMDVVAQDLASLESLYTALRLDREPNH